MTANPSPGRTPVRSRAAGKLPPPATSCRPGLQRSATEPDLVSVGIAVCCLANAVRVGFPLRGVKSSIGELRDDRIEIINEDRVLAMTGVFRALLNIQVPMLRKLPHSLCIVW